MRQFTDVESAFLKESDKVEQTTRIPYVITSNFPKLGLLTSLRFFEWAIENPEGVVSLPTGKTPEHFIKWTHYLLKNWNDPGVRSLRERYGLTTDNIPNLHNLQFVQIDEFYPIDPNQHNSFYNYVCRYYIEGFKLDPGKALLINCDDIRLQGGRTYKEVFPGGHIDLSLRNRSAESFEEEIQQESIFKIDNWCLRYEENVRAKGGIGFFLGGIGPDGHIAFNIRGSDHNVTTRLMATNFETQAAAAGDLGGIEVSRNRLVITIGLGTITYNPDGVSVIFAAGDAKSQVVKNALEKEPDVLYPATALQKQRKARFYLTEGAAAGLNDSIDNYFRNGTWTLDKTERAVFNLCKKLEKYAHNLDLEDLKNDEYCSQIPKLSLDTVVQVVKSTKKKIERGLLTEKNEVYLHTGPHHDDIMLGIFPNIIPQLREKTNQFYFSVLTSGFTAVTNTMLSYILKSTLDFIDSGMIQMIKYPDFYSKGYKIKKDKDVSNYLNMVADKNSVGKLRSICHRITRGLVDIEKVSSTEELKLTISGILEKIAGSYDGQKNPKNIQKLKGMLREFEEELVWAHYGIQVKNVRHLRLGFYKGDIFTEIPEQQRDIKPVLKMLKDIKPTVISLAFDPEGSGSDTHYKVLQAIAEALRKWRQEEDLTGLRVIGYRNVWFRFQPHEANVFTPVSLNSMAVLDRSFKDCYISQVNASFPSYEYDGPFCDLSRKVWVEQFKTIQLMLGKDFFYTHVNPKMRATHGMVFHKEMSVDEFLKHARELEKSIEGSLKGY